MPILLTSWISGLTLTVCPGHGFSPACLIVVRSALTILEKADQTNLGQLCNLTLRFFQFCLSRKCEVDGLRYDIPFPVLRSKPNSDWRCYGWNLMRGVKIEVAFYDAWPRNPTATGCHVVQGRSEQGARGEARRPLNGCPARQNTFFWLLESYQHNLWIHGKWW